MSSAPTSSTTGAARARPFLKWAGSKKQLLAAFESLYPAPKTIKGYHEPFLGSGAVFFRMRPRLGPCRISLSDNNAELINTFAAVRDQVDDVIRELAEHKAQHTQAHFYRIREKTPAELVTVAARAARFIYLNKTCFNGLYRVNSRGLFNVPMGRYENPGILDEELLRDASRELAGVALMTTHFRLVVTRARAKDFVYFDPPYDPVSDTAYFTSYTEGSFGQSDQEELAAIYRVLDARGCKLMLSNSDTQLIRRLYKGFDIRPLMARRAINVRADRRGPVKEVVVLNYAPVLST
jgi:DNA adenine methylase